MAGNVEVDLIVKAISEGFEKVSADLQKTGTGAEKAGEGAEKASFSFTELNQAWEATQKAGQIIIGTFQKVFELGNQGAQVTQTAESFDTLTASLNAPVDLLDQLRNASKGTVDDMKIMSSVMTLAAGASDELAGSMLSAAPQLMEIAKAANKLNPTLGDTTFMFDSLAMGIKRSSPLILDNLGLTIKVEAANQAYAASIGKTVDQLTAEETKMALLKATLEAGKQMMDQVGGSTDSATDSIARMETAIKNTTDALKSKLAPGISDAADAITLMITESEKLKDAFDEHAAVMAASGKSYEEYKAEMIRAAEAAGYFVTEVDGVVRISKTAAGDIEATAKTFSVLSQAAYEASGSMDMNEKVTSALSGKQEQLAEATNKVYMAANGWQQLARSLPDTLYENADAAQAVIDRNNELAESQDELAITTAGLAAGLAGELQDAMDNYSETMSDLVEEAADLNEQIADATEKYGANSEQVAELNEKLNENTEKQQEAAEALKLATAEMIYQQAAAGLDAGAALELARSMGLLSEQDYVVASSLQVLRQMYDANRDGAIDAGEAAAGYTNSVALMYRAIAELQSKNIPITFENLKKAMEELAAAAGSEDAQNAGEAAADVAEGVDDAGTASDDAEGPMSDAATSMDKLKTAASDARDPVLNLASAIDELPKTVTITFRQTGGDAVLKLIHDIRDAIAELPDRKEVNIVVDAQQNEPNINQPPEQIAGNRPGQGRGGSNVEISNTYNIYDQMAGELLLEQQRTMARGRAEELMNNGA